MKLYKRICATLSVALFWGISFAQTDKDTVYVFLEDMPDAGIYLPPPPDMTSTTYADDFAQWQWGKTIRPTERGQQANDDSQWGIGGMIILATASASFRYGLSG